MKKLLLTTALFLLPLTAVFGQSLNQSAGTGGGANLVAPPASCEFESGTMSISAIDSTESDAGIISNTKDFAITGISLVVKGFSTFNITTSLSDNKIGDGIFTSEMVSDYSAGTGDTANTGKITAKTTTPGDSVKIESVTTKIPLEIKVAAGGFRSVPAVEGQSISNKLSTVLASEENVVLTTAIFTFTCNAE